MFFSLFRIIPYQFFAYHGTPPISVETLQSVVGSSRFRRMQLISVVPGNHLLMVSEIFHNPQGFGPAGRLSLRYRVSKP